MSFPSIRLAFLFGLLGAYLFLCGCAVGPYGYGDQVSVGLGVGYYEPMGSYYGGWEPGYQVGPYRDGEPHHNGEGHPHAPSYRQASPAHGVPSIPSGGRRGGDNTGHR